MEMETHRTTTPADTGAFAGSSLLAVMMMAVAVVVLLGRLLHDRRLDGARPRHPRHVILCDNTPGGFKVRLQQ